MHIKITYVNENHKHKIDTEKKKTQMIYLCMCKLIRKL